MHKCHRKLIWKVTLMIIMMNCMTYFIKIIITMTLGFFPLSEWRVRQSIENESGQVGNVVH